MGISPISGRDVPWMRAAPASRKPNSRHANSTDQGRHLPKIIAASAM